MIFLNLVTYGMYGVGFLLWLLAVFGWLNASESPDRECCDFEYPTPLLTTTTTSSTVATSTGPGKIVVERKKNY